MVATYLQLNEHSRVPNYIIETSSLYYMNTHKISTYLVGQANSSIKSNDMRKKISNSETNFPNVLLLSFSFFILILFFYTTSFMCMLFKVLTSFASLFQCQGVSVHDIYNVNSVRWIKRSGQDEYTHLIPSYLLLIPFLFISF